MALPKYKDIIELIKKGATLEAQEKILELREAAIELQEENLSLKEELGSLRKQLQQQQEMEFDGSVYWQDGKWPFCPRCYDTRNQTVRLHKDSDGWWCHECKIHFDETTR